ncbi:FTR1 family protein [Paenibacillus chartarius]|uniref:FTR1 family protein n=1 Tax=Paenibacillus chartarius TaxID=747481 RepID=A0ABV6DK77_9BACL
MRRILICFSVLLCLLLPAASALAAGEASADNRNRVISLASDALLSSGAQDWNQAGSVITQLKTAWTIVAAGDTSKNAQSVAAAFERAETELAKPQIDSAAAYEAVSALVKAVDAYVSSGDEAGAKEKAHKQVQQTLLPILQKSLAAVQAGDWAQAKQAFGSFVGGWSKVESLIRQDDAKVYCGMEVKISGARIAINTEPPDAAKSTAKLQELIGALQSYAKGEAVAVADTPDSPDSIQTIGGLIQLLDSVKSDVDNKRSGEAADRMDRFVAVWPSLEGVVMARSPQAYDRIETKMVAVSSLIQSNPPQLEQASAALAELRKELEPYTESSSYTAWDAGSILFREGLEAILIIAALLAFLDRSGNAGKRAWIWSGAGAGILVSGIMALILSVMLAHISTGSSRELIEGITGIVAVGFMISIGAWLHSKSNLQAWNRFVEKSLSSSLTKGTLWSLFVTAFLSVMREGAETLIFYIGMASSISLWDLLIGVGAALLLLVVIGYAVIKMSSRIPVRPFFLAASLLLYYLAFKFIGVSLHALQVTGKLPSHTAGYLFDAPSFGIYGSWETTVPQLVVLVIVVWNFVRSGSRSNVNTASKTA